MTLITSPPTTSLSCIIFYPLCLLRSWLCLIYLVSLLYFLFYLFLLLLLLWPLLLPHLLLLFLLLPLA